jgi:hypothetical protein
MRRIAKTVLVIAGFVALLGGLAFAAAGHDTHIAVLASIFGYLNAARIHEATHGIHIIIGAGIMLVGAALAAAGVLAPAAPAQYLNKSRAGGKHGARDAQ